MPPTPVPADCEAVLSVARQAGPEPGSARTVAAPFGMPGTELRAFRDASGRLYALLKSSTGWKGNFDGVLCCDQPLPAGAIVRGTGRPYVSIPGDAELEELYLRNQRDERTFDVFFDLH